MVPSPVSTSFMLADKPKENRRHIQTKENLVDKAHRAMR